MSLCVFAVLLVLTALRGVRDHQVLGPCVATSTILSLHMGQKGKSIFVGRVLVLTLVSISSQRGKLLMNSVQPVFGNSGTDRLLQGFPLSFHVPGASRVVLQRSAPRTISALKRS